MKLDVEAQTYLDKVAEPLRAKGFSVSTMVKTGTVAEEIVKAAREAEVNLIAMSTHSSNGIIRWAIGSVADKVIRLEGKIPVLAVRANEKEESSVLPMGSLQSLVKHS
jgi:nucleotide-binding universal stress UspA family protein